MTPPDRFPKPQDGYKRAREIPMRRFLNKLFRDFRTTSTPRGGRRAPLRAALQVEGLEDRLVMSGTSVQQIGKTLFLDAAPGGPGSQYTIRQITLESNGAGQMQVLDNGNLVNKNQPINIGSINAVNITVAGLDEVNINDSNGMPFATGTTVTLLGSGAGNSMALFGSQAVSGSETYVAGGASFTPGMVWLDGLTFQLSNAIASVNDEIAITGTLDVQTSGTNVVLAGSNGFAQTLSGMGFGGGDTLTYANKFDVKLDEYAASANILLNATAPAALEGFFTVQLHSAGDTTTIAATPSSVFTRVRADIAPVANQATVKLQANAGGVAINGTSSTQVNVGQPQGNGLSSTKGIQSNVLVLGAGSLFLSDSGNVSTTENVTVTESSISGTGLFGNNGVTLVYGNVGTLDLVTGQDGANYTVKGSHPGAQFTSKINITFFSTLLSNVPIRADVYVDSGSRLNLQLYNQTKQQGTLLDIHTAGNASLPGTPSGTVDVSFPGVPNSLSQIGYHNFSLVFAQA
jgi:hypothetical protein